MNEKSWACGGKLLGLRILTEPVIIIVTKEIMIMIMVVPVVIVTRTVERPVGFHTCWSLFPAPVPSTHLRTLTPQAAFVHQKKYVGCVSYTCIPIYIYIYIYIYIDREPRIAGIKGMARKVGTRVSPKVTEALKHKNLYAIYLCGNPS